MAQENWGGQYFIKNYTSKEYNASFSNWRVIQSQAGTLFFGNLEGLLTFDGNRWSKPLDLFISAISENTKGQLYIGTKGDFGYLETNEFGEINFTSLKPWLKNNIELTSVIWTIVPTEEGVYFFCKQGIFYWNGQSIKVWPTEYRTKILFQDYLYSIKPKVGLVRLTNNSDEQIKGTEELANDNLSFLQRTEDMMIIGTRQNGFHKLSKSGQLAIVDGNAQDFLVQNDFFDCIVNPNNKYQAYIAGTLKGGVGLIDKNFNLTEVIDTKRGIQSNIIKGLTLDTNDNLWCAMQEGISFVELSSPWKSWENSKIEGTPWCIKRVNSILYVGTTRGLYYFDVDRFRKVNGINSKVWSLSTITKGNTKDLMVATEYGLFNVSKNKVTLLNSDVINHIITPSYLDGSVVVSRSAGSISLLYHEGNRYREKLIIQLDSKDQIISNSEEDNLGNIWLGANNKGVYKLSKINENSPQSKLYTSLEGLFGNLEPSIISIKDHLMVGTESGLFKYDQLTDRFSQFNNISDNINRMAVLNDSTIYASIRLNNGQYRIVKYILNKDGSTIKIVKPYSRLETSAVLFIYPDINGITWFATSDGLFSFDENVKKDYEVPYNTLIRKVTNLDSLVFAGSYSEIQDNSNIPSFVLDQPKSYEPTFDYNRNSIRFEYAATSYELPEKNMYSYYLEGNDKNWSAWSTENVKEYNNLSAGAYTFQVKSKNIYDNEGRTATYRFYILAPWYQTTWAYGLFTVLGVLTIWFIALAYSYRVRQQRKRLKLIVADRTFEVLSQKKEIEKQNLLLKDQNEEITLQRDNINVKNQELQMSQEEILSINEKLHELNALLEKKVEQRTSKIKTTLKQLQKTNSELDTFIYRASHDLKGPISRIHGLTSLAKLESTSPNDLKYYELIELVAKDMQKLLSKLTLVHEVINHHIDLQPIDLPTVISGVRDSIKFLDTTAENTKYAFELESALQLKSDPFLITIILSNLMENSLIFRKIYPGIEQRIFIKSHQDDDNFYFSISDTGIGISEEHIESIFNMFFRGSDQSKGSGLGLYLVQMAVEKLNGKIKVESQFGESTTFSVTIPKK
ncbi:MAG TPA: ATP-binding protein [Fulvivirga sp.]|nr:ATP-binding protein [Fulvivirga sp.]